MKNFNLYLLAIFSLLFLASCSSMNQGLYSNLKNATPYLKNSSILITNVVLQETGSEKKREEIARIVFEFAYAIEKMTSEENLDIEMLSEKIYSLIPKDKYWDDFALGIFLIYSDFYAQAQKVQDKNEKREILVEALNKIAAGCRIASQRYISK